MVPNFGRNIIRRFHNNVSEMKKLAARDWEDILQYAMPSFDGLFETSHNKIILDLLFVSATWHGLGKLRLHTDSSLLSFDGATEDIGKMCRKFAKDTCGDYETKELPSERDSRYRRQGKKRKRSLSPESRSAPRLHSFNNNTYKTHALGHYPFGVRYYGCTDGTSTQTSEKEHKRVKLMYPRTNKQNPAGQIKNHERRGRLLRHIRNKHPQTLVKPQDRRRKKIALGPKDDEPLSKSDPYARFHIAEGQRYFHHITKFLNDNRADPAVTNFRPKLYSYLLSQLWGEKCPEFLTDHEHSFLGIEKETFYTHKVVRINYTTYDLHLNQDSINPRTHPDIIVLAPEGSAHPFMYGRVIGVFHLNARVRATPLIDAVPMQRVYFLWVRWFQYDTGFKAGWKHKRLHQIRFHLGEDRAAFGFVHPTQIVRAAHLIPSFEESSTEHFLPADSVGRQYEILNAEGGRELEEDDWKYYCVNMFVDRDMMMLFRGGGIGHQHLRKHLRLFAVDAGLDKQLLPVYDENGQMVSAGQNDPDTHSEEDERLEPESFVVGSESSDEEIEVFGSDDSDSDRDDDPEDGEGEFEDYNSF
ncbi:hypothetical protein F5880DRAFT_1610641 [Lentinula raphanica]|nr:hypothetical protein F5880DRAFT_1610641 [Lentinula raphanica]